LKVLTPVGKLDKWYVRKRKGRNCSGTYEKDPSRSNTGETGVGKIACTLKKDVGPGKVAEKIQPATQGTCYSCEKKRATNLKKSHLKRKKTINSKRTGCF